MHYPAEFFAANMTIELDDTDKLRVLLERREDASASTSTRPTSTPAATASSRSPTTRCATAWARSRAPAQSAIEAIVAARDARAAPFTSLFDFCARVDRTRINKRAVEALIKAGAFDALHADALALLASVGLALDWAETQAAHADQGGLFDFGDCALHGASTQEPALVAARAVEHQGAADAREGGARLLPLGPPVRPESRPRCGGSPSARIADLIDSREPQLLAGIVGDLRVVNGQRGRVALFKLDDKSERDRGGRQRGAARSPTASCSRTTSSSSSRARCSPIASAAACASTCSSVWDLAGARCRFGKLPARRGQRQRAAGRPRCCATSRRGASPPSTARCCRAWRVRLVLQRERAVGELDLGEEARFFPTDRRSPAGASRRTARRASSMPRQPELDRRA